MTATSVTQAEIVGRRTPTVRARRALGIAGSLWPELVILIAVVVAFRSTLLDQAHFPFDAEFFNYPLVRTVQDLLSHGSLPAWDAYSYGGTPLLANAQSAWLYPPHLVLDVILNGLGKPLTEHTLDVLAVGHVALAGLGTAAVARGRRLGPAAAAFAGVFVVLSGATVSQAQHLAQTEMFGWLPWAVLVVDRIGDRGVNARRLGALGALFAVMISGGFLPLLPVFVLLLLGTALARGPRRLTALAGTAGGLVLGLVMAAAVLLPVASMLGVYPPLDLHGPMPADSLVTAIFPNAFGHWNAAYASFTGVPSLPAGGLTNTYYYLGGAAIILAPVALASGRAVIGEVVLILVLMLATFGAPAGDIANVIQGLPSVGPLWRPELAVYVVSIPLGLLLARALSRPPTPRQLAIGVATVIVLSLIGFSNLHGRALHLLADAPAIELVSLFATTALLVAAWWLHSRRPDERWAAAALGLAAVVACADLAIAVGPRYFINSPGKASPANVHSSGDGSDVVAALQDRVTADQRIAANIDDLSPAWTGFASVWHLSDANGFQPQFSKYQLARVVATGQDFKGRNRTFPIGVRVGDYLREMNVRYVVMFAGADPFGRLPGYTLVYRDSLYHVRRVPGEQTRAYVVDPACVRSRGALALEACRTGPAVSVTLSGQSGRQLRIAAPASRPLSVITGEPWYPGWQAHAGSRSLKVRRVGYLAAVSLPAGATGATLSYHAPGLLLGGILSIVAIFGALLAALLPPGTPAAALRRRRPRAAARQ